MKVAKFKSLEYGYESVSDEGLDHLPNYVRLSEYVDVEFPPLGRDEVIQKQVSALDAVRERIVEEFTGKLAEIDRRKQELLALPDMSAAS